ncbi:MAG: hypothetical protein VKL59_27480 [Nostocaceae cyanobacterium]|nr:hypothetical protein [Nostocaceae cyanobacterium]
MLSTLLFVTEEVLAQQWRPVRGGILYGISGMALISHKAKVLNFLVVHDNKKANQGRLAMITIKDKKQPVYSPLEWRSNIKLPIDLEGLTTVPGTNKPSFMAMSSTGNVYHFRLVESPVEVEGDSSLNISMIKVFDLPNISEDSNLEAFAIQEIEGKLIAVWAHRGQERDAAIMFWGVIDLNNYKISPLGSVNVKVPLNAENVRHISDLKVDKAGVVYITSASDPGDDGPFKSAVYIAGSFGWRGDKITFRRNSQLVPLYSYDYHKIEALELVPGAEGGVIFGTDDENMGSSVYWMDNN